jgi:hypothetical protein
MYTQYTYIFLQICMSTSSVVMHFIWYGQSPNPQEILYTIITGNFVFVLCGDFRNVTLE